MIRLEHDFGTRRLKICVGLALEKLLEYVGKTSRSPVWLAALVLHPKFKWQNIDQLWQHQAQRSLYTASRVRVQRLWLTQYKNQIRPTISEEVPDDAYDSDGDKDIFHGFTHSQIPISQEANGIDDEYTSYISKDRPEACHVWPLTSLLFRLCHQNLSVHLAKLAILLQREGAI